VDKIFQLEQASYLLEMMALFFGSAPANAGKTQQNCTETLASLSGQSTLEKRRKVEHS
jgi:hypothetical protein